MNILVIAPLPPINSGLPFTGNSLPVKVLVDELRENNHNVEIIDLSKSTLSSGANFERVFQILHILWKVWVKKNNKDIIYLTVAESFAGNLRDIFIYLLCFRSLKKTIIHMLGGAHMKHILYPRNILQYNINKFFVSRLKAIVVEGQAQSDTFTNAITIGRIHIVPNFAETYLFNQKQLVQDKFKATSPLKILFLSNMLYGKGYNELLDAYLLLSTDNKEQIKLDFAGGFDTEEDKNSFIEKIKHEKNITYHGSVKGETKKNLYHQAHIFCLPTYYPYEGQPFCIIEAMAGGCVIVTTNHSGIGYIFKDGINGLEVKKESVSSLTDVIEKIQNNKADLLNIGLHNLSEAREKYYQEKYLHKIMPILFNIDE